MLEYTKNQSSRKRKRKRKDPSYEIHTYYSTYTYIHTVYIRWYETGERGIASCLSSFFACTVQRGAIHPSITHTHTHTDSKREERRDRYRKQIETERRNSIDRLDADTQTHRVSLLLIFLAVLGISLVDFPVVLGIPYVPSFLLISLPLPFRVSLIALSLLLS